MTIFFLVVFGCYLFFVLFLLYGWEFSLAKSTPPSNFIHSVSVIIPLRNEEVNVEQLIKSLSEIQYPKEKLEFILVNDHSTDKSFEILNSRSLPNSRVINLDDVQSGKKAALKKGIGEASGNIIVTTDADCIHSPNWLSTINIAFSDSKINMIIGGVSHFESKSFFGKIQAIEFVSLIGSGASLLHWKVPAMANGANLAFRRNIFFEVGGYDGNEHIPSGDDEYLLRKFFNYYPAGVVFNNDPDSVVKTKPQVSMRSFFQQRIRWAGKWKHQTDVKIKLIALFVFILNGAFGYTIVLCFLRADNLLVMLLLSKAIIESVLLFRVGQFLKVRLSLLPFALLQIIYPFYVVFTAIGSLFLSFEWKERKY